MKENKLSKYKIAALIIVLVLLIPIIAISLQINSNKISRNIYVEKTNIGGMTKESAIKELEKNYDIKAIDLKYKDKSWKLDTSTIEHSFNIQEVVNKAYSFNKSNGFLEDFITTAKLYLGQKKNIQLDSKYNAEKLNAYLESVSKDINVDTKDAAINIVSGKVEVIKEQEGLILNKEKSTENIIKNINDLKNESELVVEVQEAKVKEEDLKEVDIVLGEFSTKFDSSVKGRTTNVTLAAKRTSNKLLMPGETFSYNESTGKRSIANGYKNAPVIVQGVLQEGVGGGVCQVSSTLYNAVLYSDLEILTMKNHSIPSSYVAKGRDAAVADGGIDFVFKNTLKYPVYIKNYVSGNTVTSKIYGSSKDKKNIEIRTTTDKVSKAPIKKVEDPTILKGEEKELEKPRNGYTVSTYRVYKDANGKVINTKKVTVSYYPKKQGVIAVGTKEEIKPPVVEPPIVNPPVEPPVVEPPTEPPVEPPAEQ